MNQMLNVRFGFWMSILVAFLLAVPAITATADEFSGTLNVYTDEDGTITDMELEVTAFNETSYYPIIVNEKSKAALGKLDGREVQLTGKLRDMDDQMWIVVAKCQIVLVGTLEADRDKEGKCRTLRLQCEKSGDCFDVKLDPTSQKLATEFDQRKVRVVGRMEKSGQKEFFIVDGYHEFIEAEGCFEIDEDSEGNIENLRFAFTVEKDGEEIVKTLEIGLDETGKSLAQLFAFEDVMVTGFVRKEGNKEYLVVLDCAILESDEEEDDESGIMRS